MAWPNQEALKICPGDHSYLDYLHELADGSFSGLRIRHQRCQYLAMARGDGGTWILNVDTEIVPLPLTPHAPERFLCEQGILNDLFPEEIPALLSGTADIKQFSN